jgi:hypothetical protein
MPRDYQHGYSTEPVPDSGGVERPTGVEPVEEQPVEQCAMCGADLAVQDHTYGCAHASEAVSAMDRRGRDADDRKAAAEQGFLSWVLEGWW